MRSFSVYGLIFLTGYRFHEFEEIWMLEHNSPDMQKIMVQEKSLKLPGGKTFKCAVGRAGIRLDKVEGDGATPAGLMPLRHVFYRADRVTKPNTQLPVCAMHEADAWVDQPDHPKYNMHTRLPLPNGVSHERMWRESPLYDVVVVLGYNDDPVVANKGSAVFMHIARDNYGGSAGCITLSLNDLLWVLKEVKLGDFLYVESETD
ncbi:MAG: L,D-peptidoglycan transpeptidase YkuD (ErfK/YbiS/YcfS/YnhG family) [Reinekea sp.]|jgi:L,D-peptidoglycan transpeptidase YkuD (ErfK/YbiS/YcfS/YnhG family)